jgi:hypothetical protein
MKISVSRAVVYILGLTGILIRDPEIVLDESRCKVYVT